MDEIESEILEFLSRESSGDSQDSEVYGEIALTHHAEKRLRKRLGLKRKAIPKVVAEAYLDGKRLSELSGSFRRYADYLRHRDHAKIIAHNGVMFIFKGNVLITAWMAPSRFRKQF